MIQDYLDEYQKKRIIDRLKLDFKEELKKSQNDNKRIKFYTNFINHLDIFVTELYNNGVLFYGFKIKMPFLEEDSIQLWEIVHCQVEKWVIDFRDQIELVEFCYISIELEKYKNEKGIICEGLPYINGIIGVRSFIGQNKYFFNEIKKIFNLSHLCCNVVELSTISLIMNFWKFILKEKNFKFHRFTQYSLFFDHFYGAISELENQYDENDHVAFGLDENLISKFNDIRGVGQIKPDNFVIINYIITLYQQYNKYYINNNLLFKQIENTKYSWEVFDSIDFFDRNNVNIFEFIRNKFPQHLRSIRIYDNFIKHWDIFFQKIKHKNNYIITLQLTENIIEFRDGLYLLDKNIFLNFNDNFQLNFCSNKYYNEDYVNCKNNPPVMWLKVISKNLKKSKINTFIINLGRVFNSDFSIIEKKKLIIILFDIFDTKLEEKLHHEIPKIIIYCNNLFKKKTKNYNDIKKIS